MVADSRQTASMEFSIAAEEKQPFDIANGFSGAGMGDGPAGECLLVVAHDQAVGVKMRQV